MVLEQISSTRQDSLLSQIFLNTCSGLVWFHSRAQVWYGGVRSAGLVWFYAGVNVLRFDMVLAGVFMCSGLVWFSTLVFMCSGLVWFYGGVHLLRFGMVLRW